MTKEEFMALSSEELWQVCLEWRGINKEDACGDCGGSGVKTYANTATWHSHSIVGQALTDDVCNICWGSGNKNKPWTNLSKLQC